MSTLSIVRVFERLSRTHRSGLPAGCPPDSLKDVLLHVCENGYGRHRTPSTESLPTVPRSIASVCSSRNLRIVARAAEAENRGKRRRWTKPRQQKARCGIDTPTRQRRLTPFCNGQAEQEELLKERSERDHATKEKFVQPPSARMRALSIDVGGLISGLRLRRTSTGKSTRRSSHFRRLALEMGRLVSRSRSLHDMQPRRHIAQCPCRRLRGLSTSATPLSSCVVSADSFRSDCEGL